MDDMFDDCVVDNVLNNIQKKKKKDSKGKGSRGELGLIGELEKRFPKMLFSRSIGSGNRWSQARLTETAKKVFTGDIITPNNFLFAIECKNGYDHINIERAVKRVKEGKSGNKQLDGFLEQAIKDGNRVKKKPMMCWKRGYKPWLIFLKTEHLTEELKNKEGRIDYKEWSILLLEDVLKSPDSFFVKARNAKIHKVVGESGDA